MLEKDLTQKVGSLDWKDVEAQLKIIFYDILFAPIVDLVRAKTPQKIDKKLVMNSAEDVIIAALSTGRLQYKDGVFSGQLNAAIGKALRSMGGKFDSRERVYRVDPSRVAGSIKAQAAVYQQTAKDTHKAILDQLDKVQEGLDSAVEVYTVDPTYTMGRLEKGFQKVAQKLEVSPELSALSKKNLCKDYTNNMKLWIKKWTKGAIGDLRVGVEKNAMEGLRFDNLIELIRSRYGVAESKAKFLARQETSLFMSKYRQARFGEAGVTHYEWSTSHDERVRVSHKHLSGRVFAYNDPPIVDPATGRKANPGEDFNCRCIDIPILEPLRKYQEAA